MAPKFINKFQDQRVLVIGGTAGIGYAVAEGAVEFGAHTIVASSKKDNVDKAVQALKKSYPEASGRIEGYVCDLTADDLEGTITKLMDSATKNNSVKLDHIVDTAGGVPKQMSIDNANVADMAAFAERRLYPRIMLAKVARKYLKDTYTSSITYTSGSLAYKPMAGFGPMAGMVGGDSLTKGLAVDLAPIRVNVIIPGAIHTSLLEKFAQGGDVKAMLEYFSTKTILKRVGQVEDVAESYLGAMKNYFQTGTASHCEGGYYLA